jgi:hypothetical protein
MIGACASGSAQVPQGAKKPSAERFASDRYIVGRACVPLTERAGEDRREADQRARAEVAKQLEVKVIQVVEDIQREEQKDGERSDSYSVSIQTQEFVDKTLKGVRIKERRKDDERGLKCSLAVLDKTAMAFQLREEIQRDLKEISSNLASAQSARGAGNPAEALRAYSLAMLSVDRVAVHEKMLLMLGYGPPEVPSRAGIRREWAEVLEGIRLIRTGGEAQRASPRSPLPEPLRVAALGRSGEPVQNLPLKALRIPEGCEMQAAARTDACGEAEWWVYRVVSNRIALEEVAIGLDWERLLAAERQDVEAPPPWDLWDSREVVFTYRMPAPGDHLVGVAVFESGTGRPMRTSPIQSSLLEGLQQVGFRTQDLLSASSFRTRPDTVEALKLLEGKVDILLIGDVSLRYSSETSGFTFYRARGIVEGVALATGTTIVTLDVEAKGGGLDDDRAVRKALSNLAKKLEQEIGSALEESLE